MVDITMVSENGVGEEQPAGNNCSTPSEMFLNIPKSAAVAFCGLKRPSYDNTAIQK
jgi:hypothetical protein